MLSVQSVLFDKSKFTEEIARRWLKEYGYLFNNKMHETDEYLRFRQQIPKKYAQYRTIDIADGIKGIIMII